MRKVVLNRGRLTLVDDQIQGFLERRVTPIGNSAKADCPKRYIGKRVYLLVCKE
jgi:putative transposon-encoded protein